LWALRKRIGKGPLIAALFYGGTLLPALGFTNVYPMRYSFVADHFAYLAIIGPIVLVCSLLTSYLVARARGTVREKDRAANRTAPASLYATGGVILGVLWLLNWNQAGIYENRQTLWLDTIAKNPASFLAHNNLGTIYIDQGRVDLAIRHLRESVRHKTDFHEARSNLGRALAMKGLLDEGAVHSAEAVRLKPDSHEAHYNLANILARQGKLAEAIEHFEAALEIKPRSALAHNNLANVLAQSQRLDEAILHYRAAIGIMPNYALAHRNMGLALSNRGKHEEAILSYRQALRYNPQDATAHFNLGELLAQKGDTEGAIREFRAALRIDRRHAPARQALEALTNPPQSSNP
jgi:tetratricopeptide (TPR) repeat protein